MVDPTFFFVVLFGGALVGIVTAGVRGHDTLRSAIDIAAGAIGGFCGTPLWIAFVQHILPRIAEPLPGASREYASLLSTLYYVSPILGGFLGVAVVALLYRVLKRAPRAEPRLAIFGDFVRIVGIVYLVVAICLTLTIVAVAVAQSRWEIVSSPALLIDVAYGSALILIGWGIRRAAAQRA